MLKENLEKEDKKEIVFYRRDNVIYVDFILSSMIKSINYMYSEDYQCEHKELMRGSHLFRLKRFYNRTRFSNYETIGKEREGYMSEINLNMDMRRDD